MHGELGDMECSAIGLQLLASSTEMCLREIQTELRMQKTVKCSALQDKIRKSINRIIRERAEHEDALCELQREHGKTFSTLEEYMKRHSTTLEEGFVAYITQEITSVKALVAEIDKRLEDSKSEVEEAVRICGETSQDYL